MHRRGGFSDDDPYDTPSSPMADDTSSASGKVKQVRRIPRPMNSFMVFAKTRRKVLQERFPNYDNKEVSRMLGEEWAKLSDDDKQVYVEEAKRLAEQHKIDFPDWKFTRSTTRTKKRRPTNGSPTSMCERQAVVATQRSNLVTQSPSALRQAMKLEDSPLMSGRPTFMTNVPFFMTPPPAYPYGCFANMGSIGPGAGDSPSVVDDMLPPYRMPPTPARIDTV